MKLYLKNFMSHDDTELDLPSKGVVVVTGLNGSGKSALIESVSIGLFGKGLRGSRWSPWRAGSAGSVMINDTHIALERRWTGKAKTFSWNLVGSAPVDYDTQSKAQLAFESVVGTHEAWRRTSVFSSSDAAHFTMSTDAERKELLETMLGLGWFDRALDACRKDLKVAGMSFDAAKAEARLMKERVEGHKRALASIQEVEEAIGESEVGDLKVDAARIKLMIDESSTDIDAMNARIREETHSSGGLEERVAHMERQLRAIDHDNCPTCGQALEQTKRKALKAEMAIAQKVVAERQATSARNTDSLREQLAELWVETKVLQRKHEAISTHIRDIEAAARQRTIVAAQRGRSEGQLAVDEGSYLKSIAEMKQHAIEVTELEAVETILGTRGIRAQVLGKTLSGIEALANTWLERLNSKITIELRSYTEKKTGGSIDSISLSLTGAGGEHGYMGASAGERKRVDVALLLALAEIASSGPGAPAVSTPIFFDEVFDSLDHYGVEAVGEVLEELAKERCVVVITHNEGVASAVPHDLHLTVVAGKLLC